jgi:hypothetical protein
VDGRLWFSDSALRAVARCDTEAALKYALRRTTIGESVALSVGIAVHEADAVFMKEGSVDTAITALRAAYDRLELTGMAEVTPKGYPEGRTIGNVARICREWWGRRRVDVPYEILPQWVEVPFAVPLSDMPGAPVYFGVIDSIVRSKADGYLYVRDLKTTTKRLDAWWMKQFVKSTQGSGYVWAANVSLGEPIAGFIIDALHLGHLPGSDRACKAHPGLKFADCGHLHMESTLAHFSRTQDDVNEWKRDALFFASDLDETIRFTTTFEELLEQPMRGMFAGICQNCDFFDFCDANRNPNMGRIMTVEMEDR